MTNKPDDTLVASIETLVETFRGAMIALLPYAEQSQMQWRDDDHPDWERICECLFDAFVRGPISTDYGRQDGDRRLARYDIDEANYKSNSWVRVEIKGVQSELALVRFLTVDDPFDAVQVAEIDPRSLVVRRRLTLRWPVEGVSLVAHGGNGTMRVVNEIEAIE